MTFKPLAICLVVASTLLSNGALAEDADQGATKITANYGVYWAGLHFGDVRLVITVRGSRYKMKGNGRFSIIGGLIYEWRGSTASAGKLTKSGPKPSLYYPCTFFSAITLNTRSVTGQIATQIPSRSA